MSLDYDAPQLGMGQMIYPDGYYEIISGHRRKHAAEKLGYRKVPVIIRVLSEDDFILSMVDSNLHRERISYSEKAFAYKLKNDVLKRKSGRNKWPVWGAAGGKDGSVNYFQFIDADGTISEPMGIAARRVMNTNDVVRMVTATGGGYGDPFKRPADKVAMDVKNEYITVDQAKEDYGVLVDPETFKVLGLTEERQKAEKERLRPLFRAFAEKYVEVANAVLQSTLKVSVSHGQLIKVAEHGQIQLFFGFHTGTSHGALKRRPISLF